MENYTENILKSISQEIERKHLEDEKLRAPVYKLIDGAPKANTEDPTISVDQKADSKE